ncbi:hypothetical protein ANCDUO_00811 [Ancylostoma duodenale]|uniref:Ras family protein n=1 Tax=Ancylostoma duodenale TaxID=51022 RepID=A0A0C2E0M3_9BILA|nr:hypothetical protein ANCDUO_00811 [Ancylostoma duodenale]
MAENIASTDCIMVMLLGDSCTGKTCLLVRYKDGAFLNNNFISTVGIDYRNKVIEMENKKIKLQVRFFVHFSFNSWGPEVHPNIRLRKEHVCKELKLPQKFIDGSANLKNSPDFKMPFIGRYAGPNVFITAEQAYSSSSPSQAFFFGPLSESRFL